jgi:hypothetical protein
MNVISALTKSLTLRATGKLALAMLMIAGTLSVAAAQQTFKTADEAAEALVAAARTGDRKAVTDVLGPGSAEIVSSGDPVQDENMRKLFIAAYEAKHSVKTDGDKPATLLIGNDDFPFAIPLVQKGGSWSFDTEAGREEVLARRIGRNELAAIQVCLAFFDAQNDYADMMPKIDGMAVYAQKVVSSPGKKDGLYWPSAAGETPSPIGEVVAEAAKRGYRAGSGEPFHGYFYKILKRQGPKAPGGELEYVVDGKMIGGFALVAWPAEYGNSGLTTFLVSHDGIVYQKDLGEGTQRIASRMTTFNPDHTWRRVVATDEQPAGK